MSSCIVRACVDADRRASVLGTRSRRQNSASIMATRSIPNDWTETLPAHFFYVLGVAALALSIPRDAFAHSSREAVLMVGLWRYGWGVTVICSIVEMSDQRLIRQVYAMVVGEDNPNVKLIFVRPSGFVAVDTVSVGALAIGNVTGLSTAKSFKKGEAILSIKDRTGALNPVISPCDCDVMALATSENSLVREGDILLRMAPADAKPFIRAKIDSAMMMKLKPETTVDIRFQVGHRAAFTLGTHPLQTIETGQFMRDATGIDVRLHTGREDMKANAAGETATVVFDASPFPILRRWLLL
jgi:hypothetical protein